MKSLILFLFFSLNFLTAQDWIKTCIDMTINTKFNQAESLLSQRMDDGDSSLEVYFYYASVLNSKMTHFENNANQKEFYQALNKVIEKGTEKLDDENLDNKAKGRLLFYIGSAYGYLGFYQGQIGEWFSAVRNGSKAHDFLERAVATDSTQWDAYLGLGAYKYWLSTKVHWIPFIPDEREEGIALIKKTIKHNPKSRFMAMHQLVYILLDYGDYEQAEIIAGQLVENYPQSQFMYWAYTHVYMKKRDFPQAIKAYQKLLQLIEDDANANPNHRVTCLARLADMYSRSGDCQQANQIRLQIEQDAYYKTHRNNDEVNDLMSRITELCPK
jgi:tetratricopeptide (TPR) repeat protein